MLTKQERYQQLIDKAKKRITSFPKLGNQWKKSNTILQNNVILPSSYPFRSCQQINNYMPIAHQQKSKQYTQSAPISLKYEWPLSCIGLVLCEHHQNNQIFYVYGTGTLIHNKIVLTSAQNLYCRRVNKQYVNIRFITGVNNNKCCGIYDIKQVNYPKQYTMQQQEYENYNFAVLQLYDDLSENCGYVGWKTSTKPPVTKLISYALMIDNKDGFKLQQINKKNQLKFGQGYQGSGVLMKGNEINYYIVGLNILSQTKQYSVLSEKMRNIVNQWIGVTTIDLSWRKIGVQECIQLSKGNWIYLNTINLQNNNINEQGSKYLSQAKWIYLSIINLNYNKIGAQGFKYLSQANWANLTTINLYNNKIGAQGCKHLGQTNWKNLNTIDLALNDIGAQGCKSLVQTNWANLTTINLYNNNIRVQGCKYLSQANWTNLNTINIDSNNIKTSGCKYLSQANWPLLTKIKLYDNNINTQGCKYLCQANWIHLKKIALGQTNAINIIDKMLLKQLWINAID